MDDAVKSNYLGAKYFLDNLKKDKPRILRSELLRGYSVTLYDKSTTVKTYYDTQDCFFNQVGLTININKLSNNKGELVVRFNSATNRIEFLSNIPDTFAKEVNPKSTVRDHIDFITNAIYDLIPNGISADVKQMLRTARPIMVAEKKRERYRLINANGFKTILSFSNSTYSNYLNRVRRKVEILELESNSNNPQYFPVFQKQLLFEFPTLIQTETSDLNVGFKVCEKR